MNVPNKFAYLIHQVTSIQIVDTFDNLRNNHKYYGIWFLMIFIYILSSFQNMWFLFGIWVTTSLIQVSISLLSIPANLNNAVDWMF